MSKSHTGQGNILRWIGSGSGIFWVSGKPGSGKSTFMKFLANHHNVRRALASWAAPQPILIATHYFWNSGTLMQKSEQGLLQSILHDILWQAPEITADVCKQRWIDTPRTDGRDLGTSSENPWSVGELRECLRRVIRQRISTIRVCLFVDGLDESQGDHLDMAMFLAELCRSPVLKLCVSSRPWNVFEQSFGKSASSKIYMHELTKPDILRYTRSRLGEHPHWSDTVCPDEGQMLIEAITFRARGVFLWVFLVTKILREGLTNGDTFEDLKIMLESFPPELEPFYRHILDSIPPFYHSKMCGFMKIAISYHELDFRIYYFNEMEYKDVDFATKEAVEPVHEVDFIRNRSRMVARLDAICKGLLELNGGSIVRFIHRTVRDWSATEPVQKYLNQKTRDGFSTTLSSLRATLAWFKHPRGTTIPWNPLVAPTSVFLSLAPRISSLKDVGSQHANTANTVLDGFFPAIQDLTAQGFLQGTYHTAQTLDSSSLLFQGVLIVGGFWDYLDAKLQEDDAYFDNLSRTPAHAFALKSHGIDAFQAQRKTCTSDREALVRSRVITTLLRSVLQHSIPPFKRCTAQENGNSALGKQIESALKLSRLLVVLLDTAPTIAWISTISSTCDKAKVRAWAGLFMLPFRGCLEYFAAEYPQFLDGFCSQILNGGDCSLMLLQYDSKTTIWDLLCGEVRRLGRKALRAQSPQENLVSYVIEKFAIRWSELPDAKESPRAAIQEGFPTKASRRLIMQMDKDDLLEKDGGNFESPLGQEGFQLSHTDHSGGISLFEELQPLEGEQVGRTRRKHSLEPSQERPRPKRASIGLHA